LTLQTFFRRFITFHDVAFCGFAAVRY
jgi:hypothetical protein